MTDLEITRLCAKAMWIIDAYPMFGGNPYDPLTNAAQNAELDTVLLKHGHYVISLDGFWFYLTGQCDPLYWWFTDMTGLANLRRARCECVAKLMEG